MAASPLQMLFDIVRGVPREAIGLTGFALAILAVVGGALEIGAHGASPWLIGLSYGGPGAVAFGLYWTVTRRD